MNDFLLILKTFTIWMPLALILGVTRFIWHLIKSIISETKREKYKLSSKNA